jgi:UDP-N-acetylglucosamine 4,6-dehydratase
MTRFWITLQQGVRFVIDSLSRMKGGELFVPKIPSTDIMTLADALAPDCKREIVGIRPGEKLHELMIGPDDARRTHDVGSHYVVEPEFPWWDGAHLTDGALVPLNFSYSSETNPHKLSVTDVRELLQSLDLG